MAETRRTAWGKALDHAQPPFIYVEEREPAWYCKTDLLMEHRSARRKKEILPSATTYELEGIVLTEINQRKTRTVGSHLIC